MAPPLAREFVVDALDALDGPALATFLAPGEAGVAPDRLGVALAGAAHDRLAARVAVVLPGSARRVFEAARARAAERSAAAVAARRAVVDSLFWALLYWHAPGEYEELVEGEEIHPQIIDDLRADGLEVADLGCGAGRLTVPLARRAAHVVAVDAVPPLLDRLCGHLEDAGVRDRVDVRRGAFVALPLASASVDLAVACSSLTSRPPYGGDAAVIEAARVVRPGGRLVVIWPDDPGYFTARGFVHVTAPGPMAVRFRDQSTAVRLCRRFYSEAAARWVEETGSVAVPFEVLGTAPPRDACVLTVGAGGGDELALSPAPRHPGVEV